MIYVGECQEYYFPASERLIMTDFNFVENTFIVPYTEEVADYCDPFCCGDEDLDEFFSHDVFMYEEVLK